ncbi:ABC transporter ATP-binding protein/permease [Devosia sp.]|uniref:ABC transporter ATP-binding protein/permease n=1 Tax=Devosia sp. TaxID=1871048 RepID=UPI001B1708CA|nr:SbmA/BacA-like family transporter [Devosia sp.]MBO9590699.1 ABC transporter ATP-binding protein/permease [Devosia sp.]
MSRIFAQFWRLMQLCLAGPGGKWSIALFALIVALDLGGVYATILIVSWTGAFYGALEAMDGAEAVRQVGIFGMIVAGNSARHLIGQLMRKRLEMLWRGRLTSGALDIWLANKAYWHIANATFAHWGNASGGPKGYAVDNPDQRIADDCRIFITALLGEVLDMISRIVGLFSYIALLWSLTNFPLSLAPIGINIEIPNYMIWAAFIYVALASLLTHALGHPLKGLMVEQQRREANFRFALARLRSNFDEVAMSNGERAERGVFDMRFNAIVTNWKKLVNRELILGCFTYPFNHSVLRIPLFVALPGYLAGHVAFGGLMQLSTAFSSVVTSLSWFIFSYRDLAELVAASSRLDNFLEAAKAAGATGRGIVHETAAGPVLSLRDVRVNTPEARPLLEVPMMDIKQGEAVWLRGASGLGKTTLMKALAGLWPHGAGTIFSPEASKTFLPQRPYFPIGTVRDALAYPRAVGDYSAETLDATLEKVGLSHIAGVEFGRSDTRTGHGLSGGEQQRLALARLLLLRPQWALLDEPASALDQAAEAELFALLRRELPDATFIIVAHRQPQGLGEVRVVHLGPAVVSTPSTLPQLPDIVPA